MSSHNQTDLKRIDHKLQRILDNAAVGRVDRVFSVLLTITIFVLGLLLNGVLSVTGLIRAWTIGLLFLLSFTLIGEFDAMLRDSDKKRVAYWMTLLFGLFMAFSLFPMAALDFFGLELRMVILIMTPIPFLYFGLIYWVDKAFTNFFNNLPIREFPHKAWNYFGRRIALGLMIFVGTVVVITFFGI